MRQKKFLSQVFLNDARVVEEIASAVPLEGKTVLEIGAGTGVLTKALARKAGRVVAIEVDESLKLELEENLRSIKNVELVFEDALEFDFVGFKTIFGNLPHHISSPLLFKILESGFEEAVLCFQKEFGERVVAQPGSREWSRLSVMTQAACEPKLLFLIPRRAFKPVPKTDSIVVYLRKKVKPIALNAILVNALFQHKNQSVKNALLHSTRFLKKTRGEVKEFIEALELSDKKVRELRLEELQKISRKWGLTRYINCSNRRLRASVCFRECECDSLHAI